MTISFNSIGSLGRLGNQMFQFAALKGIAKHRGFDYILIPSEDNDEYKDHKLLTLFKMEDVPIDNINTTQKLTQKDFTFDEDLFNNCPDNVDIFGYFQTEKFFAHIRNELLKDFEFKNVENMIIPEGDYVAIHVRRGDYVSLTEHHPVCSLEYYQKAMSMFPNFNFVVISDDLDWCKKQEIFKNCIFLDTNNLANDMYVMTVARHNIIANSSFSWWGAWLNKNANKIVVAPKQWFGDKIQNNTKDLYCSDWIII
jgi:hypothetical protein